MAKEKTIVPADKKTAEPARREGWDLFTSLHDEADRLFREFSARWPGTAFGMGRAMPTERLGGLGALWSGGSPAVDVVDLEDKVEVRAELPGIARDDIDLELGDGTLSLKAEKREEREEGEKESRYYLSERRYGSYSRTVPLPDGLDMDKVAASFENGVLTVTFPKTEDARKQPKKGAIKGH